MPKILIALPAYNEAESLPPLLERFREVMTKMAEPWEIVVVNDGSKDATGEVIDRARAAGMPVTRIDHPQNRGLGPAIITGLHAALERSGSPDDIVVGMDADNTHDPVYVPEMVRRIEAGADIVIASRYRRGSRQIGVPWNRRFLSFGGRITFMLFLRLRGVRDYTCGYRAYRARLIRDGFDRYGDNLIERSGFACTDELLVKLAPMASRIEEVPFVLHYDRKRGQSKLPLMRTIASTFKMLMHRPK